jgi:hypothetical protein
MACLDRAEAEWDVFFFFDDGSRDDLIDRIFQFLRTANNADKTSAARMYGQHELMARLGNALAKKMKIHVEFRDSGLFRSRCGWMVQGRIHPALPSAKTGHGGMNPALQEAEPQIQMQNNGESTGLNDLLLMPWQLAPSLLTCRPQINRNWL